MALLSARASDIGELLDRWRSVQSLRVALPILIAPTARPECAQGWKCQRAAFVNSEFSPLATFQAKAGIAMLWDSWLNVWQGRSLPKRRRVASGSSLKRAADVASRSRSDRRQPGVLRLDAALH
ncbi:MAG: hypothetical protein NT013_00905 [Planctomycetia bacterium]|nr:hypothetical protein [Planctomycetia bacterium]